MLNNLNLKLVAMMLFVLFGISYTPRGDMYAEVVPEIPTKIVSIDPKQLHCMAKNIFYEAGGESIKGQAAVARVVLNRVAHGFANTPCGVIYQAKVVDDVKVCQFSWVCENKGEPNKNSYRYKVAQQVAYDVMANNKHQDVIPNSVLFFHNLSVTPMWPYAEAVKIGNHIFYSKFKKKNLKPKKKPVSPVSVDI
jgi:spore germination cell wall hydrolase CwlJ-like protein